MRRGFVAKGAAVTSGTSGRGVIGLRNGMGWDGRWEVGGVGGVHVRLEKSPVGVMSCGPRRVERVEAEVRTNVPRPVGCIVEM